LIGRSPAFVDTMEMVGRVVSTNLPVLITGESGTGKEVVARTIHNRSRRAAGSFVAINCGALSAELIESELFGHVRGAFTGADRERVGLWEEAQGGTIFLDEITETSPTFQVKLLRALQEHEVRRVGANKSVKVDARVIAATNRDVEREVSEGRFRQDLHFRLNAVTIHLPALRERRGDIMLLAKRFAKRFGQPEAHPVSFLSETVRLLESYHWPGNVRELEHTVMRAVALCDHTIRPEDLSGRIRKAANVGPKEDTKSDAEENRILTIDDWCSLNELEGKYLARTLEHTHGNKLAAARLLKVDRKTLNRMIIRHQVSVQARVVSRRCFQNEPR
jgi:transcriptional regulator with GAF, ATPase, and Fis domain